MPWGRYLLSNNYVLNLSEPLTINNRLFSINNRFGLTVNKNGFIYVYDRTLSTIIYFLNKTIVKNTKAMIIEKTGISVVFIDSNKNEISKVVLNIPLIKSKCPECKDPFNCIIDNDTGNLIIYGNSFFNSTSNELQTLINNERGLVSSMSMNNQDINLEDIINSDKDILLTQKEDYLYCSSLDAGCIK
jgi:hypothetical protein